MATSPSSPSRRELVLAQLRAERTELIPSTLGFEGTVGERLDDYYGSTAWRRRVANDIVRLCAVEPQRLEPTSAGYERDAFGSVWRKDLRPMHLETPGLREPSFDDYQFPTLEQFLDPEREQSTRELLARNPDGFTAIGFGFGLFERTWTIRGFENSLMDAAADPDFYEELVERIFQLHMDFVEHCLTFPVDGVMFSDDWGDQRGVIVGPERWRRFFKPRLAALYQRVHEAGKFTLSHCCGSVIDIMPDIVEIGLDVLQSVQPEARGMNPYELKKAYGGNITFWGCLGSQSTIPFGTPGEIHAEVDRLCAEMAPGGHYVLGPAKALQPETTTENAAAVVEAFAEHTFGSVD